MGYVHLRRSWGELLLPDDSRWVLFSCACSWMTIQTPWELVQVTHDSLLNDCGILAPIVRSFQCRSAIEIYLKLAAPVVPVGCPQSNLNCLGTVCVCERACVCLFVFVAVVRCDT